MNTNSYVEDDQKILLSSDQRAVLRLLRESMLQPDSLSAEDSEQSFDCKRVSKMILKNGILLTVFAVLPLELQEMLRGKYDSALKQAVLQDYEGNRLIDTFADAGVDCIALKGWELRKLYPLPFMRQMADVDIFIRPYDYLQLKKMMEGNHFTCGGKSSWKHDDFYKGEVTVEIHKRLSDNEDTLQIWQEGIWERAKRKKDHVFEMEIEDFIVFHFIHMYKDFLNGSLGLRRIVDTWLLSHMKINESQVEDVLTKIGIGEFKKRMIELSYATMGEKRIGADTALLLRHAFDYGIFGSDLSYKTGRIVTRSKKSLLVGKIKSFVSAVLLPFGRMKVHYPILKKFPVLLPVYWVKRAWELLRSSGIKRNREKLNYGNVKKADYEEMQAFFKAGGV